MLQVLSNERQTRAERCAANELNALFKHQPGCHFGLAAIRVLLRNQLSERGHFSDKWVLALRRVLHQILALSCISKADVQETTHGPCSTITTPVPIDSILQLFLRILANVPAAAMQLKNVDGK